MGECLAAALPLIFVIAALVIARIRYLARSRPGAARRHHFCFFNLRVRSVPRIMKRRTAARVCGDCDYELAPDSDGTCPMCARFQQLRIDFADPGPSELDRPVTHPAETLDAQSSVPPSRHPPTTSEYRTIIAAQRARSRSVPSVIRNPALRAIQAPPAESSAPSTPGSAAPAEEPKAPSPQPSTAPPEKASAPGVTLAPEADTGLPPLPAHPVAPAHPVTQAPAVRHGASRSREGARKPSPATVALVILCVVIGALAGAAVPLFLSVR